MPLEGLNEFAACKRCVSSLTVGAAPGSVIVAGLMQRFGRGIVREHVLVELGLFEPSIDSEHIEPTRTRNARSGRARTSLAL